MAEESLSSSITTQVPENEVKRQRKKRGGNTARRRRAKRADHATSALHASSSDQHQNDSRSISTPGVIELRSKDNAILSECDQNMLIRQLGYLPGNALLVAAREDRTCVDRIELPLVDGTTSEIGADGAIYLDADTKEIEEEYNVRAPTVLKLYPLAARTPHVGGKTGKCFKARKRGAAEALHTSDEVKDNNYESNESSQDNDKNKHRNWTLDDDHQSIVEPFPTIYWLTSPKLRILISKLEDMPKYCVRRMQERLRSDPEALSCMEKAHFNYGEERWNLLTENDREEIVGRKWEGVLGNSRGVAGIQKTDAVKCLHTHTAHYLSGEKNNIIGKWTVDALLEEFGSS
jgi:hypothetical protein